MTFRCAVCKNTFLIENSEEEFCCPFCGSLAIAAVGYEYEEDYMVDEE